MQVTFATAADADAVFSLATALSLDGPLDHLAFNLQFDEVLRSEHCVALVATDESTVVGYAVGGVLPMPIYSGGAALLQELFVAESDRHGGVGRALVEAFTEWAARRGAARVVLATSRAGAFYEALGFTTRAQFYQRTVST